MPAPTLCLQKFKLGIPIRDMRLLDPVLLTSETGKILVRDNAIVFSIEHVRLIISATVVIIPRDGFEHNPVNARWATNGCLVDRLVLAGRPAEQGVHQNPMHQAVNQQRSLTQHPCASPRAGVKHNPVNARRGLTRRSPGRQAAWARTGHCVALSRWTGGINGSLLRHSSHSSGDPQGQVLRSLSAMPGAASLIGGRGAHRDNLHSAPKQQVGWARRHRLACTLAAHVTITQDGL